MQMFAMRGGQFILLRNSFVGIQNLPLRTVPPSSSRFTLLLGLVAGLPALSIDLSAPTLPILPQALNTTVFVAGLSLSLFVLGFGLGQLAGGRASDQLGRRPTLLAALACYVLAGLCCSCATTGGQLATGRFVQGAAAGASSVQAFAIVQDLFTGEQARRKQAYVSVVLTIMPMLAPALGAGIIMLANWRVVHLSMAIGGLLLTAAVTLFMTESRSAQAVPQARGIGFADGMGILRHTDFRRIALVNALSYGSIFAYIAGAPVVLVAQFGCTNTDYALIFACTAFALSAGTMANARLAHRLNCHSLVRPALITQAAVNVGLVFCAVMVPLFGPWPLLPLLLVGCFVRGIISPNLAHAALSQQREHAGLAAALLGLLQLVTAAAASAVLARLLGQFGAVSVAATMASLSVAALLLWWATNLARVLADRG